MPPNPSKFDIDNVRVTKIQGGNINKSFVVEGMAVARMTSGTETCKEKAKVAVYAEGLEAASTETKGTVLLENADQLMNYTKNEEAKMDDFIKSIKDAGVEVVICGGSISEIAGHFLNKYRILALKITSKFELRRICRTVGATSILRNGPPTPEEIGYVESIKVEEISSQKLTVLKSKDAKVSTIVLRAASPNVLDEVERAIDNAVNVVRCVTKSAGFVAGGGATEIELAHKLQQFGATVPGLDQYAVLKFAEALEVVPKVLAENAGHSNIDALTALYAAHQKGEQATGIDVDGGGLLLNAADKGILDHAESKRWALRFTLDAVLTILQVDQIIMAKQAGGPKGGDGGGGRDAD
jgi:T-complex protein 1 subunit theta